MQPVLTAAQSRAFDKHLIEELGIPSLVLMENAARGVISALEDWLTLDSEIVIFAGPGNNGGDGFAVARLLLERGVQPTVLLAADSSKLSPDARHQYDLLLTLLDPEEIYEIERTEDVFELVEPPDIIIDALLGTGSSGELRGAIKEAVQAIAQLQEWYGSKVLAIDIPTGLNSDTGIHESESGFPLAARADRTVTMAAPKIGFYLGRSRDYTGKISIASLGAPYEDLVDESALRSFVVSGTDAVKQIHPFPYTASKFTRGRILCLCGSRGMTGAAIMSAGSSLKSGAGYLTVAVPASERHIVAQAMPELLTIGIAEEEHGSPSAAAWLDLQEEFEKNDVVLIGCGYRAYPETAEFVRKVISEVNKPMIVDGGGLRSLEGHLDILRSRRAPTILTPNVGELAGLVGKPWQEVDRDMLAIARKLATTYEVIIVAKGVPEYTINSDGTTYINSTGNPGMGTAGTGDVLAGMIATMLAQNPGSPWEAAMTAVYLSGLAGDLAAQEKTTHGMTATDVIKKLPEAFKALGVQ